MVSCYHVLKCWVQCHVSEVSCFISYHVLKYRGPAPVAKPTKALLATGVIMVCCISDYTMWEVIKMRKKKLFVSSAYDAVDDMSDCSRRIQVISSQILFYAQDTDKDDPPEFPKELLRPSGEATLKNCSPTDEYIRGIPKNLGFDWKTKDWTDVMPKFMDFVDKGNKYLTFLVVKRRREMDDLCHGPDPYCNVSEEPAAPYEGQRAKKMRAGPSLKKDFKAFLNWLRACGAMVLKFSYAAGQAVGPEYLGMERDERLRKKKPNSFVSLAKHGETEYEAGLKRYVWTITEWAQYWLEEHQDLIEQYNNLKRQHVTMFNEEARKKNEELSSTQGEGVPQKALPQYQDFILDSFGEIGSDVIFRGELDRMKDNIHQALWVY